MSSRVKALAVLNVLGWLVAVPILLIAVVDPFVDFGDWPDRLIGGRQGDVQMRTPEREPAPAAKRPAREREATDDPLRAAREAIGRFRPAISAAATGGAPLATFRGGGGGTQGGGSPGSGLRGRVGPRIPTQPVQPLGPLPVPGAAPVVPVPVGGTTPASPPVFVPDVPQPVPTLPGRDTATPPVPERPVAAAPPGDPEGPGPGPTPTPTPEPTATPEPTVTPEPTPEPTVTPDPSATPEPTVTPEPTATATPEPPAPETPVPPADPPEEPENPPPPPPPPPADEDTKIPPAVKPPQDQMPAPDNPAPPGPPPPPPS